MPVTIVVRRLPITRQTIIAIEQRRYSPSLESAFRIARVFGVGVEDVFAWDAGRGEREPQGCERIDQPGEAN